MSQKVASLEIELLMATGQAVSDIIRFGGVIDKQSAEAIKSLDRIDAAMQGIGDMSGPSQQMVRFAEQAAKSAVDAAREFARIEKAGESLSSQLERQISVFGKTTAEIRAMKVEAAAAAAEQQGQAELAGRLRAQEEELWGMEYAAARKAEQARQALAEAADAAAAAREREAGAIRDAADAYQLFEARARQAMQVYRDQQAIDAAQQKQREAIAVREAGVAYQLFEARVRAGVVAMREEDEAAARDAIAVQRLRDMLDPAAASQTRVAEAIAEARRVMVDAGFSAEELAKVEEMLAERGGELTSSHGKMSIATMEAQHIFRAFGDSVAAGQSPIRAATMEMGRASEALSFWAMSSGQTEGAMGKLGAFLNGPWGLALTLGIAVLSPFVSKLWEEGDASDKAGDAHDKHADAATRLMRAIKDLNVELGKEVTQSASTLAAHFNEAVQLQRQEVATRNLTKAKLEAALANERATEAVPGGSVGGTSLAAGGVDAARAASLQAQIAAQNAAIAIAQQNVQLARMPIIQQQVKEATDATARSTGEFDRAVARLGAEYLHHQIDAATYRKELQGLTEQHKAAEEAMRREGSASTGLSDAEAKLAAAHTGVQKAEAQLALVRAQANVDLKNHVITEAERTKRIADAQSKVYAARDAEQALRHERTDQAKATRDAAKEERELQALYTTLMAKLDPVGGAYRSYGQELDNIAKLQKAGMLTADEAVQAQLDASKNLRAELDRLAKAEGDLPGWGKIDLAAGIKSAAKDVADYLRDHDPLKDWQDQQKKQWDELATQIDQMGTNLEHAFGKGGKAISGMLNAMKVYADQQRKIDADSGDEDERRRKSTDNQIEGMLNLISSAKSLASEHSKAYQVMEAAEKALTVVQVARTAVDVAGGAARMFATLGPAGFAAVAAMLGVMATLGFSGASPGSPSDFTKGNTGTGTVLGDTSAQSDSLKRSIDFLGDVDHQTMVFSSQMLQALKSIDGKLGAAASQIAQTGTANAAVSSINTGGAITGAEIGKSALSAGTGALAGFVLGGPIGAILGTVLGGLIGSIVNGLFGTTTKVIGSGLTALPKTLGDIVSSGYDLLSYADVEKKKHFLGITTSTKYSTQLGPGDPDAAAQITLVFQQLYKAIDAAAGPLGVATDDIEQRLNSFVIDLGKINLQGLSGDDIQKQLEAVFSAASDTIAENVLPGLEKFQQVGEGYFETLVRVAATVEAVTNSLDELGISTQGLGIDAKMGIAGMFDSVSDMQSSVESYFSTFYSDAEQTAAKTAQLGKVFASLGIIMPDSIASYRALVEAQDLNTDAGQQTYAQLIKLAPAFAAVATSTQDATSAAAILREQQDLQQQLLEAEGDTAALRQAELARLDPSNRALQERIWALQDEKTAADAAAQASQAIANERDGLTQQLLQLQGNTDAIRAGQLAGLDESNRALQQQIWALQDQAAATDAATKAAQDAATAEQAIADERAGLIDQIYQLTGDVGAQRREALAKIDDSNRAIQEQVWALQDQAAATDAATQAAQAAAAAEDTIAQQRAGLMTQLWQLQGDTASIRAAELAGLDESNRGLQQQIYDLTDQQAAAAAAQQQAEAAAQAAQQLADAWKTIGSSIMDEVERIRGLTSSESDTYASLLGRFNVATAAARAGDQAAGQSLPELSKSLLDAAALVATSQQELRRIQAVTASSLEQTADLIDVATSASTAATSGFGASGTGFGSTDEQWWNTFASAAQSSTPSNDNMLAELQALRGEVAQLRSENTAGHAANASANNRTARVLENVTGESGGDAVTVEIRAAS